MCFLDWGESPTFSGSCLSAASRHCGSTGGRKSRALRVTVARPFPLARRPGCNHLALDLLRSIWHPRSLKRKPTCAFWIVLNLPHSRATDSYSVSVPLVVRISVPVTPACTGSPLPVGIGVSLPYSPVIVKSLWRHTQMVRYSKISRILM